ncbi:MAG: hypothetical protein AAGE98_02690 [Actinomycetota bacterium]
MSELVRPTPSKGVLLRRGVTRACPVCGRRGLTRRVVELRPECPRCGFVFERDPGHFVGAVGMSTILTFGLILISILVGLWVLWPDVNFFGLAAVPLLIAVLVPPLFHPTAKTLWAGIDLMMNPVRPGEAVSDLLDPDLLLRETVVDAEEGPTEEG